MTFVCNWAQAKCLKVTLWLGTHRYMSIEKRSDLKIQVKCRYLKQFVSSSHPSEERNCCSHLVAMNQEAFKILAVVPGKKEKKKTHNLSVRLSKHRYWFVLHVKHRNPSPPPHQDGLPQKCSQKCVNSDFTSSIKSCPFLFGSTSVISIWILLLVPNMTLKVQPQFYAISMPCMPSAPISTCWHSPSVGWIWGQQCLCHNASLFSI